MRLKNVLIVATALLISAMLYDGLYQKDAPLMWLASTDSSYAYIRAALIALLVTLLLSSPPRSLHFRVSLAAIAAALLVSVVWLSASYAVGVVDAVVFAEVAVIFMIEALETDVAKVRRLGFAKLSAK
ncbi:MAG: hypothetical protein ABWX90_00440 [Candidatus Saccharimonadales bacterium]